MHETFTSLLCASAMAVALVAPANAQDVNASPTYDTVRLNPGFTPDPYIVQLDSGGSISANGISESCAGYIANAPDVRLRYGSGSGALPLIIGVQSDYDTTLVINAPDGRWYCDDDRGAGLDPLVRFHEPLAGAYEIWVGTWGDTDVHPAQLVITELSSTLPDDQANSEPDPAPRVNSNSRATYGSVSLDTGFTPDPYLIRVQAGGANSASNMASGCAGYIASAPDVELNYRAGSLPLYISADSMADTTLVVRAPNGSIYCDDDSGEGTNPRVWLEIPISGTYDIWVGTYSSGALQSAELNISELYSE